MERFRISDSEFQKKLNVSTELFEAYKAGYSDGVAVTKTIYEVNLKKLQQRLNKNGK